MTWLVTIRNRSGLRLKPGDVKLTEVLPKGFEIDPEQPSNLPDGAISIRPPKDGHGPTFTYRLDREMEPHSGLVVSIFGKQKLPPDLEEQVVQNHATVKDTNPAHIEPSLDPHPNDVYAPLTVRARNN